MLDYRNILRVASDPHKSMRTMELELRSYNMLEYNMFRQAQISFPGENDLHMILPDSVIAREKSGILIEYLQKVFCERCGMDLKVGDAGK